MEKSLPDINCREGRQKLQTPTAVRSDRSCTHQLQSGTTTEAAHTNCCQGQQKLHTPTAVKDNNRSCTHQLLSGTTEAAHTNCCQGQQKLHTLHQLLSRTTTEAAHTNSCQGQQKLHTPTAVRDDRSCTHQLQTSVLFCAEPEVDEICLLRASE